MLDNQDGYQGGDVPLPIPVIDPEIGDLCRNAILNGNFPTYQGVPSTGDWNSHHGPGPLPRVPDVIAVEEAQEALRMKNEGGDAFHLFYPNRTDPPSQGSFLVRTEGHVISGHWWTDVVDGRVYFDLIPEL